MQNENEMPESSPESAASGRSVITEQDGGPARSADTHNFDLEALPDWDGPVEVVFSISEENDAGGVSYCWVERQGTEFILFGNELGQMGEPCADALSALNSSDAEFGMDYTHIESTLTPEEFRGACSCIDFSAVGLLTVNGIEIAARDVEQIVAGYQAK
jgi:hypothetical protein